MGRQAWPLGRLRVEGRKNLRVEGRKVERKSPHTGDCSPGPYKAQWPGRTRKPTPRLGGPDPGGS